MKNSYKLRNLKTWSQVVALSRGLWNSKDKAAWWRKYITQGVGGVYIFLLLSVLSVSCCL